MTKVRKRIFEIVQIGAAQDFISRSFDVIISCVIILNIIVAFISTFSLPENIKNTLYVLEYATTIFFTIEYILRLFTADFLYPKKTKVMAVIAFIFSFYGIIDFLSFFPFYLPFFTPTGVAVFRLFRVFRIFRLFKINSQFDAFNVIVEVLNEKK
ncbi:MAG: ion transporter, partial [Lachnospiraceae bacterium]|nr:ion transporter [Lachnospiraceae bacterium]